MLNSHMPAPNTRASNEQSMVEAEMTYTSWDNSCKDMALDPWGYGRECRRSADHFLHGTNHASGFGDGYFAWEA